MYRKRQHTSTEKPKYSVRNKEKTPSSFYKMFILASSSLLVIYCSIIGISADDPVVETSNGPVAGFRQSVQGVTVNTFLNIPFAEAPVGQLRFKPPHPVSNWTETYQAKSQGNSCHQLLFTNFQGRQGEKMENIWNANTTRSEDCLQINLWVPNTTKVKATMVWIFGGGFAYGTPTLELYDGKLLASKRNVIVASINYRTGPLGFLYLGNEDAPGNAGLLDQQLAIKWIHTNIAAFGGNPNNITLFGESSGAASVSYHLMAPNSQSYFQRGILQSGSALAPWAFQEPMLAKQYTLKLAKKMKCPYTSASDIIKCLRTKDPATLSEVQWELPITPLSFPFVPTIDNHFISQSPTEFFHSGNLSNKDILVGVNTHEAMYFLFYNVLGKLQWPNNTLNREDFLLRLPSIVAKNGIEAETKNHSQVFIDAILYLYESNILPGNQGNYMDILDNIGGDFAFKCPLINLAKLYAKKFGGRVGVYAYDFQQRPTVSEWPDWTGILHGDEIEFVFGKPLQEGSKYTEGEKTLSADMMKYWSTFAIEGKPNDTWIPYSADFEEYIILNAKSKSYEKGKGLRRKECLFWSDYIPKLMSELKKAKTQIYEACVNASVTVSPCLKFFSMSFCALLCVLQFLNLR